MGGWCRRPRKRPAACPAERTAAASTVGTGLVRLAAMAAGVAGGGLLALCETRGAVIFDPGDPDFFRRAAALLALTPGAELALVLLWLLAPGPPR